MPHGKSANKRRRQAERRRDQNRSSRSKLRNAIRRVRAAQTTSDGEAAYRAAEQLLDRAAGKGLQHRNTVARMKSRLRKDLARTS